METAKRYSTLIFLLSVTIAFGSYAFASQNSFIQQYLHSQSMPSLPPKAPHEAVDVLIIGGGASGLSAAHTLYRHQHDVRIFDDDQPRNKWDTPTHALPTWEGQKPSKIRDASRRELQQTGLVNFIPLRVENIRKVKELFYVKTSNGVEYAGRKVLLSMGVRFKLLEIPGYTDCFPERIFHCLFTFGWEHKGSASAGILAVGFAGSPFHASILIDDARKFAEKVTVYTHGNRELLEGIKQAARDNTTHVYYDERRIVGMEKLATGVRLRFEDGQTKEEAFVVHQPGTEVNPAFIEQLGLTLNERGDIVTKMPFYQTAAEGVYAAGDCASPFKIIANAMLMGANAGAGLARELSTRVTGNAIDRFA